MKRLETLKKLNVVDTNPVVEYVNGEPTVDLYWDAEGNLFRFALPWVDSK